MILTQNRPIYSQIKTISNSSVFFSQNRDISKQIIESRGNFFIAPGRRKMR